MGREQTEAFNDYRVDSTFGLREPTLIDGVPADELEPISAVEGMRPMTPSPACEIVFSDGAEPCKKYLWLVLANDLPIAIEDNDAAARNRPARGWLSHTNLSGSSAAHVGGELWFFDASRIVINGGSSRFRPRCATELDVVANGFAEMGYQVGNMGWNPATDSPVRNYKESEVRWIPQR